MPTEVFRAFEERTGLRIIRGGHNLDPAAIEEPLHRHPAVQIAAAVGRPNAHAGELPVAYVQLKVGASATEGELSEFLRREIAERAALPKHVRIVYASGEDLQAGAQADGGEG
jgi:fatty-acyl-CoA synthase